MKRLLTSIILLLFIFPTVAQKKENLNVKIQHFIDSCQSNKFFPGLTATVIFPDGTISSFVTGYSDTLARTKLKNTDKLLGGSTGKMYFSILTMMAVKQGKVSLDEKVEKYLGKKDWYQHVPNARQITLRHLLSHSSGIEEYYVADQFLADLKSDADKVWKPEELVAYILDRPPLFEAGSNFSYADTNYIIVGLVLEEVLGKKAYDEIQKNIIAPLQLKYTVPSTSRRIAGLVNGYTAPYLPFKENGAVLKNGVMTINTQFEWAGGGFATNTIDLAKLVRALFDGKLIDETLLAEMKKGIEASALGKNYEYGLGLIIAPSPYGKSYGHGGWFPGYMSDVVHFPDQDITIAVQLNSDDIKITKGPTLYLQKIATLVVKGLK